MKKKERIKLELNKIAQRDGMLNPHNVVRFAENPKTALHSCFTWDDTKAAENWRLHQARMLIRVVVNVIPFDGEENEYRAFVSLKEDRYGHIGYRPMVSVLNSADLREQMLAEVIEEMEVFKEKYKQFKELVEIFDMAQSRVRNLSHRIAKKVPRKPIETRISQARA